MKKVNPEEIGYFGKPVTALPRDELLEVLSYIAGVIHKCTDEDKRIEELLFVKKNTEDIK